MNLTISGVHNYKLSEGTREFIQNKFEKISRHLRENELTKAEMSIELVHEKDFLLKSNLHMKWGKDIHLEKRGTDLRDTVEGMMKSLDENIIQEKKRHHEH